MALLQQKLLASLLVIFGISAAVSAGNGHDAAPNVTRLTDLFGHLTFNHGFTEFFGGSNIQPINNGSYANLILNKSSGSGLVSQSKYYYGFFSAAIKLPSGYTSGVVVAFYMSNADLFPHNHDEIDIELLGHEKRKDWVLQTNMFLVDNIPVREILYNDAISSVYPSKPMSVYATIWDGSEWATHGGKYPVDYNVSSRDPVDGEEFAKLSEQQRMGMEWARKKLMFYSYCKDSSRFKVLPPECKAK
ncbi:putative xyloglucan endotransglucosylase/hydrolase protein 33 [Vitis vinifera]|uniref:Xyloglucan endotransglucosylase/hydrolase n=1 Tax=Vitis vinifera TaxID=29760 RepID=A0A438EHV0_VITVI|nr:putative xyloglucan endotransglucosylase/hydrolase protein 33 [Vitis vinifera]